jgi:hypothetical protein
MKEPVAQLYKVDGRYELVYPDHGLCIRANHAEWALEAAGEIIARMERLRASGELEELEMMQAFEEDPDLPFKITALKFSNNSRFDTVPQCVVTLGETDYRWVAQDGRKEANGQIMERVIDSSLRRPNQTFDVSPNSFSSSSFA